MDKVIFDRARIIQGIESSSRKISNYYSGLKDPLVVVPVLYGGMFCYVDLVRNIQNRTVLGVIRTNYYGKDEVQLDEVKRIYEDLDVEGKRVLIVDEICYSGSTLKEVKNHIISLGAEEVKTFALIDHIRDNRVHSPDFSALVYRGDDWLYGYGMDLDGLYRDSVEIYGKEI